MTLSKWGDLSAPSLIWHIPSLHMTNTCKSDLFTCTSSPVIQVCICTCPGVLMPDFCSNICTWYLGQSCTLSEYIYCTVRVGIECPAIRSISRQKTISVRAMCALSIVYL